ncbi:MAG: NAD(P)-dependent oxidoreductase [Phycisphaerales bacterium]
MRILIADKFESSGIDALKALGCAVTQDADLSPDTMPAAIAKHDPQILVVRGTKVPAAAIQAGKNLSLIVRAGAGYDSIDVAAASASSVFVANCPGKNSIAVAELAWGLILACDRRIAQQAAELRQGRWNKKEYSRAGGIHGRTLGIVGLGQIGSEVVKRAHAFGMPVIAWSRSLTDEAAEQMEIERADSPLEVAKRADVVSLHVAANKDTHKIVNDRFCAALKQGAILINTTRGSVVDEEALLKAIEDKNLMVGLDVYEGEPGGGVAEFHSALAAHPRVIGTHHIGASTDQAQNAIAEETVRIIREYKETGRVRNVINKAERPPASHMLTVRHKNRPGVLAAVIGAISKAEINIQDMENIIYDGGEAAVARIKLQSAPSAPTIAAVEAGSPHIIGTELVTLES